MAGLFVATGRQGSDSHILAILETAKSEWIEHDKSATSH
jgi:hypothetical protein